MGYIGLLTTSNLQGVAGPVPLAGGTTSRGAGRSTDTGLWPRLVSPNSNIQCRICRIFHTSI